MEFWAGVLTLSSALVIAWAVDSSNSKRLGSRQRYRFAAPLRIGGAAIACFGAAFSLWMLARHDVVVAQWFASDRGFMVITALIGFEFIAYGVASSRRRT